MWIKLVGQKTCSLNFLSRRIFDRTPLSLDVAIEEDKYFRVVSICWYGKQ